MLKKRIILFSLLIISTLGSKEPEILYLTWRDDPSTTMTVMWHTSSDDQSAEVLFKKPAQKTWQKTNGSVARLCRSSINIHTVDLKRLDPNSEYLFRISEGEIHKFRTLPRDLKRPLKVAVGGDAYYSQDRNERMNRLVAKSDPDFVIMAGDIAYTEGLRRAFKTHNWRIERWETFFREWTEQMVTDSGRILPIVPTIGNHDLREGFDNPFKCEVIFYQVFAFPEEGVPFRAMDVGGKARFYLLDSGHSFPVGGGQSEWLEASLDSAQGKMDYHIPVYHIAAYPTETSYTHRASCDIRKFWVPLFERYHVKISMEHDNHTFKRTFPLRGGTVSPDGIHYLGDGSWGVPPLKPHRHWYLAKAAQCNCYWMLTLAEDSCQCDAFNGKGEKIDSLCIPSLKSRAVQITD